MALNFIFYNFLKGIEFATDQTWSKFMILLNINVVAQFLGACFAGTLVMRETISLFDKCFSDL